MTHRQVQKRFDARQSGNTLRNTAAPMWAGDMPDLQITVTPPLRSDGVARMLVALGDVGIRVSQVVPTDNDDGTYRITLNASLSAAARVLTGIGCVVTTNEGAHSYGDQLGHEREGSPYSDYA